MRLYKLSGAEIISSNCKSYLKRHFKIASLMFFFFIISCRICKRFAPLKRSHQRMVYSKWINLKNTILEQQTLNSKDVETRETFPTFENCTGRIIGFHDITVKLPWRHARNIYDCSLIYETIGPVLTTNEIPMILFAVFQYVLFWVKKNIIIWPQLAKNGVKVPIFPHLSFLRLATAALHSKLLFLYPC